MLAFNQGHQGRRQPLVVVLLAVLLLHHRLGANAAGAEAAGEILVSIRPMVLVSPQFASESECAAMLELIERCHREDWHECTEQRSRLHREANGSHTSTRPLRNSTSFTLSLPGELNPVVDSLVRRAHILARHPVTAGEGVQIASYHAGDYYGFHHDSLTRRSTLLLYLNDVPKGDGGETIFPLVRSLDVPADRPAPLPPAVIGKDRGHLDFKVERMEDLTPYCESDFYLKIRPEKGKALLFFSYNPDYSMDGYAIHGACPLRRGHKAIFQRWMRFDPNTLLQKSSEDIQRARLFWGHDRLVRPGSAETTARPSRSNFLAATSEPIGNSSELEL